MVKSYVLISCDIGAEDELKTKLLEIENIEKTIITYGQYDIVAEIETQKDEDMAKLIIQKNSTARKNTYYGHVKCITLIFLP